jgi:hypothetical protein
MEPQLQVPSFEMTIAINKDAYENDEAKKYFKDVHSLSQLMLQRNEIDLSNMKIPDLIHKLSRLNLQTDKPIDGLKMAMEGIPEQQRAFIMVYFHKLLTQVEDQALGVSASLNLRTAGPSEMVTEPSEQMIAGSSEVTHTVTPDNNRRAKRKSRTGEIPGRNMPAVRLFCDKVDHVLSR